MRDRAESAVSKNILALVRERMRNSEKMLYELSERSALVASDVRKGKISLKTPYAFADGARRFFSEEPLPPEDALGEYLPFLRAELDCGRVASIAAFSLFLAEALEGFSFTPFPQIKAPSRMRVAYVPSPMAQIAFERLSEVVSETAVLYVSGAQEACSAVTASHAHLALLPLSGENGERIGAMERLTERCRMSLVCAIRIYPDGENETLYGVFAPTPLSLTPSPCSHTEIRFTADSFARISHVLSCLPLFGFEVLRHADTPAEYGGVSARTVLGGDGDIKALWFFLSLAAGGLEILGRYSYI